ncbi:trypsin-like peptidase domain-containing protein [Asticcacaulis machinosus]|uniref:Trypsin-like peptidase domain-containing protein n=1 Tax=Asticcacaulis machinosus TaxID=2984211 RepID=A0ABT5HHS4_9CAUL|nr:trypsin-like peptidase domain-containing protein [Asticcacaulis machinosus]MDC7675144.1 trypsin-like peptidase domain-containing protein [Asticcacaulis machinosus]
MSSAREKMDRLLLPVLGEAHLSRQSVSERGRITDARWYGSAMLLAAMLDQSKGELTDIEGLRLEQELERSGEFAAELIRARDVPASAAGSVELQALIEADGSNPATLLLNGRPSIRNALDTRVRDFFLLDGTQEAVLATGRIFGNARHVGTGVLVRLEKNGQSLEGVLTARHVAQAMSHRSGAMFADAAIDFLGEFGGSGQNAHTLTGILECSADEITDTSPIDTFDYALLKVGPPLSERPLPSPASIDIRPRPSAGGQIAIVGYPAKPEHVRSNLDPDSVWYRLFEGIWNVKRMMPARIFTPADRPEVSTLDARTFLHNATTTQGASGGPILTAAGGRVGAIHLGGKETDGNTGQWLSSIVSDL